MAESITRIQGDKEAQYLGLIPQLQGLLSGETDFIANAANLCAALKAQFDFFWVGFYLIKDDVLVLGPFQGPVACTRIQKGKGVCGAAWEQEKALIVPDVDAFSGHIACSNQSRSEIVLPLFRNGACAGVLDIDSDRLNAFDQIDETYLRAILQLLN